MNETEKLFESKIEEYLISEEGGWQKATDSGFRSEEYKGMALDIVTLTDFVKASQPLAWKRFERMCTINPVRQFYKAFESAVQQQGLLDVLRHGFKHRGVQFTVCYFKPESTLNAISIANYQKNICQCVRQWHYSETNTNTVDMMLAINGIPVVALELKNQLTGQTIDDAIRQWQYSRDPKEPSFGFNRRILAYFAVDLYKVSMTTQLAREKTRFLPFNQGSNGPGKDGGAGNPPSATLTGEKLFNMERSYRAICVVKTEDICDSGIISNVESFKNIATSGHNPRRFVAFNQQRYDAMKDAALRRRMAAIFQLTLDDSGLIDTSSSDASEKLIKVLCNKGMVDPFGNVPVEVSAVSRW